MPPAVAAIAAVAAKITVGQVLLNIAVSFSLNALMSALAPKPKAPRFNSGLSSGITQQIREPVTSRKIVYGEARVSGPIALPVATSDNKYLHLVILLAGHEITEIGEIWLNDVSIPPDALDVNGLVTTGQYADLVRIKKHLGADDQTADSALVAEVTEWTTAHRLRGIAYIYIRMEYDSEVFPAGIPNVSAWIKGRTVEDPRTAAVLWTPNIALQARDFLLDARHGLGVDAADLDDTSIGAAANECEEIVSTANLDTIVSSVDTTGDLLTLAGERLKLQTGDQVEILTTDTAPGGLATSTNYYVIVYQRKDTPRIKLAASLDAAIAGSEIDITDAGTGTHTVRKTGEPRYFGGGLLDTAAEIGDNLRDILSGMGGSAVYTGGVWALNAAAYQTPTITLDESHLRRPVELQTDVQRREKINTVKGVYISPLNDGQPSDYPAVTNSTYVTSDGGVELIGDLDLPFTQRPHTAQRLAKIKLCRARQGMVLHYPCNMHGLRLKTGNTVMIDNARLGFSGKVFEVRGWKMTVDDNGQGVLIPGVDLILQAIASTDFDWATSEETAVDPLTGITVPDVFTVAALQGMTVNSEQVETQQGDSVFKLLVAWAQHSNQFVLNGGRIEAQYKKSSAVDWRNVPPVVGAAEQLEVSLAAELGTDYDIRIRAFNNFGVPSAYQSILNFEVGTSGGVGSTADWGDVATAHSTSGDWGDVATAHSTSDDWEFVT